MIFIFKDINITKADLSVIDNLKTSQVFVISDFKWELRLSGHFFEGGATRSFRDFIFAQKSYHGEFLTLD